MPLCLLGALARDGDEQHVLVVVVECEHVESSSKVFPNIPSQRRKRPSKWRILATTSSILAAGLNQVISGALRICNDPDNG